jgi:hypothetical protein
MTEINFIYPESNSITFIENLILSWGSRYLELEPTTTHTSRKTQSPHSKTSHLTILTSPPAWSSLLFIPFAVKNTKKLTKFANRRLKYYRSVEFAMIGEETDLL